MPCASAMMLGLATMHSQDQPFEYDGVRDIVIDRRCTVLLQHTLDDGGAMESQRQTRESKRRIDVIVTIETQSDAVKMENTGKQEAHHKMW